MRKPPEIQMYDGDGVETPEARQIRHQREAEEAEARKIAEKKHQEEKKLRRALDYKHNHIPSYTLIHAEIDKKCSQV